MATYPYSLGNRFFLRFHQHGPESLSAKDRRLDSHIPRYGVLRDLNSVGVHVAT